MMSLPWLPIVALMLTAGVLWRGSRPTRRDLIRLVALLTAAAALRGVLGLWGPLHVNGQGPFWIRGALEPAELHAYGPGYAELFGWLARRVREPDLAIFTFNLILSSLAPALGVAIGRAAGLSTSAAFAAGLVLAADPVSVRMGATEGYFVPIITLVLGAEWLLLLAANAWGRSERGDATLALVAAGLLAAAAVRIHPCAYLPVAIAPLVTLGAAGLGTWRKRAVACAASALLVAAVVCVTSGTVIAAVLPATLSSAGHSRGALHPRLMHVAPLLLLGAAVLAGRRYVRAPGLTLLGLASLGAQLGTRAVYAQHPFWQLAYDRLYWPGILLGAAACVPRLVEPPMRAAALAIAAIAAQLGAEWPEVRSTTTEQLEYRFLRATFRQAPKDCVVASVSRVGKRIVYIPDYLLPGPRATPARRLDIAGPAELTSTPVPGSCLLYVQSSLCTSAEARALCADVASHATLEPIASRQLPARPSYLELPYDREVVGTAVFRVRSHATASTEPVVAAPGAPDERCPIAITRAAAQSLFDRLRELGEPDGCRLHGLETDRSRMVARFRARDGALHELRIAPAPCAERDSDVVGHAALRAPDTFGRECPDTLRALRRQLEAAPVR